MDKSLSVDDLSGEKTKNFSKEMKKLACVAKDLLIGAFPLGLYYLVYKDEKRKETKGDAADRISDYMYITFVEVNKGVLYYEPLIKPLYEKLS